MFTKYDKCYPHWSQMSTLQQSHKIIIYQIQREIINLKKH